MAIIGIDYRHFDASAERAAGQYHFLYFTLAATLKARFRQHDAAMPVAPSRRRFRRGQAGHNTLGSCPPRLLMRTISRRDDTACHH